MQLSLRETPPRSALEQRKLTAALRLILHFSAQVIAREAP
jgi:hypothetical protein